MRDLDVAYLGREIAVDARTDMRLSVSSSSDATGTEVIDAVVEDWSSSFVVARKTWSITGTLAVGPELAFALFHSEHTPALPDRLLGTSILALRDDHGSHENSFLASLS